MAWLLIVIAVISLWIMSLCKVLYSSCIPARPVFLSNGSGERGKGRNVLLVIAHPDDESMFFAPTILFLCSKGHNVHILCMSTGNAEGKGNVRQEEFYRACVILKVPLEQVKILNHPNLLDGFDKPWDHQILATNIGEEVKSRGIDTLITFDNFGVSGHPNHRDVHHGICMLLREKSHRHIEAWELVSTSIFRKYSGPVDIWLSILCTFCYQSGKVYCLPNIHPCRSYHAMAEHDSQWIWFRKLFVLFSSYTYMNTLQKISI